ncbi:MAG: stage III sporulation protein AC [Christensenellales bacterium]
MNIGILFKIAAIGIVAAIINTVLKKSDKDELATLTTLAALVLVLFIIIDMLGGLLDTLKSIFRLY